MDDLGCRIFNPRAKRSAKDLPMRAKSKWTLGGVVLWLMAAVAATFVVCSQARPVSAPPLAADHPEVDIELVE